MALCRVADRASYSEGMSRTSVGRNTYLSIPPIRTSRLRVTHWSYFSEIVVSVQMPAVADPDMFPDMPGFTRCRW